MTAAVEIRPFSDGDEGAVAALWREVFPNDPAHNVPEQDIARKREVQRELFFVAEQDNAIIGTAMGGYDGHRGWVYLVAVKPAARGAGVGSRLMHRIEEALKALGCTKLNLQVRAGNEPVIQFYEALGYSQEPRTSMGKRLTETP